MRRRSKIISMLLATLVVVSLAAAGCGKKEAPKAAPETKPSGQPSEAAKSGEPIAVRMASGTAGGLYQVYCTAWAQILQKAVPGLKVQVESSGGGGSNVVLVNDGKDVIGITSSGVAWEGFHGLEWAKGKKYDSIRTLLPVYPSITAIYAPAKTGIKSLKDIEGKRLTLGPAGGGIDVLGRQMLDILGIKPKSIVNMNFADVVQSMKDGLIDVGMCCAGHPFSPLVELERTMEVNHIEITPEESKKVLEKYPYYPVVTLSKSFYKYMPKDYEHLAMYSFAVCNKDLPEEVAYKIVKATFENQKDLVAAVAAAKDTVPENIKYVNTPLHVGAIKYYKEIGIEIPKELVPPEYKGN